MGVFLIILFSVINTFCLVCKKKYRKDTAEIASSIHIYLLISCCVAVLYYFCMAKGNIRTNSITLLYACLFALLIFLSVVIEMIAYGKTDLVNISVFSGAGNIIIPFLFGYFFYKEEVSVSKLLAVVLLAVVAVMPLLHKKGKEQEGLSGYLYCLLLFLIAGCTTIIYKLYGDDVRTMSETNFCFWTNVILLPFILTILAKSYGFKKLNNDLREMSKKSCLLAVFTVAMANTSTLISMQALKMVDVVVYTILQNSFAMLFTAIAARLLFKEKMDGKRWFSIVISILAVILNSMNV